jgi:hypothetical protein
VIWQPWAEERLAQIWTAAPDRQAVTAVANALDDRLQRDAESVGESRTGLTRVVIELPLVVYFDVHEEDRLVYVLTVRYATRRKPGG